MDILKIFNYQKKENLLIVFLYLCNSFLQVRAAVFIGVAVNSVIEGNWEGFQRNIFLSIVFFGASLVNSFFLQRFTQKVMNAMGRLFRIQLLERIVQQEYREIAHTNAHTYSSWLQNDMKIIESQVFLGAYNSIRFLGNAFFSLLALFQLFWGLGLLAFGLAFFLILLPKILKVKMEKELKLLSQENENFLSKLNEQFENIDSYYTFGRFPLMKEKVVRFIENLNIQQLSVANVQALNTFILSFSNVVSQVTLLFFTGYFSYIGVLGIGFIVTVAELGTKIFDSLNIVLQYFSVMISTNGLFEKYPIGDNTRKNQRCQKFQKLVVNNLSIIKNGEYLFQDLNFSVNRGEKLALIGESGKGKTTLFHTISGKEEFDSGEILFNNRSIREVSLRMNKVFALPQQVELFSESVEENILLGVAKDEKKFQKILKVTGLDRQKIAEGTILGLDKKNISGGQKQRVALARSLYFEPQVLLLDESFSNLDESSSKEILENLVRMEDLTILFITHQPNLLPREFRKLEIFGSSLF